MSDLAKAILIEEEYKQYRMRDEEPYSLSDAVKQFGFTTLSDYFAAKKEYEFLSSNFNFYEHEPITGVAKAIELLHEQKPFVLFADSESTFVFKGNNCTINQRYCDEHNITVVELHTGAGCIVNLAGDFSICLCCKRSIVDSSSYILSKVSEILQKYTDKQVMPAGNDILIDGKKVCGSAGYYQGDFFMFAGYFSFSDKGDLINNICLTEKMGKDVGWIDFMSRDLFKEDLLLWLCLK